MVTQPKCVQFKSKNTAFLFFGIFPLPSRYSDGGSIFHLFSKAF